MARSKGITATKDIQVGDVLRLSARLALDDPDTNLDYVYGYVTAKRHKTVSTRRDQDDLGDVTGYQVNLIHIREDAERIAREMDYPVFELPGKDLGFEIDGAASSQRYSVVICPIDIRADRDLLTAPAAYSAFRAGDFSESAIHARIIEFSARQPSNTREVPIPSQRLDYVISVVNRSRDFEFRQQRVRKIKPPEGIRRTKRYGTLGSEKGSGQKFIIDLTIEEAQRILKEDLEKKPELKDIFNKLAQVFPEEEYSLKGLLELFEKAAKAAQTDPLKQQVLSLLTQTDVSPVSSISEIVSRGLIGETNPEGKAGLIATKTAMAFLKRIADCQKPEVLAQIAENPGAVDERTKRMASIKSLQDLANIPKEVLRDDYGAYPSHLDAIYNGIQKTLRNVDDSEKIKIPSISEIVSRGMANETDSDGRPGLIATKTGMAFLKRIADCQTPEMLAMIAESPDSVDDVTRHMASIKSLEDLAQISKDTLRDKYGAYPSHLDSIYNGIQKTFDNYNRTLSTDTLAIPSVTTASISLEDATKSLKGLVDTFIQEASKLYTSSIPSTPQERAALAQKYEVKSEGGQSPNYIFIKKL